MIKYKISCNYFSSKKTGAIYRKRIKVNIKTWEKFLEQSRKETGEYLKFLKSKGKCWTTDDTFKFQEEDEDGAYKYLTISRAKYFKEFLDNPNDKRLHKYGEPCNICVLVTESEV